jgi:hypothetical protein
MDPGNPYEDQPAILDARLRELPIELVLLTDRDDPPATWSPGTPR